MGYMPTKLATELKPPPPERKSRGPFDHAGRPFDDPLWGLPHERCSCTDCAGWRLRWAHRLAYTPR